MTQEYLAQILDSGAARLCPFCRKQHTEKAYDDERRRAYQCLNCGAVESISKGNGSWWYHGWQELDDDEQPGFRIDGDGVKERAPIRYLEWISLATNGNPDAIESI